MGFECNSEFEIRRKIRDMLQGKKLTAIVLSAGKGKRMGSEVSKQYMSLCDHPVISYTLRAFEESVADEIILVVGAGEKVYCKEEIVEKYKIKKVKKIVVGGKERYDSVYEGLKQAGDTDIILVHDGARAFVSPDIIRSAAEQAIETDACVVAVKVKDTIKRSDENRRAVQTLEREQLWQVQTPQCFSYPKIRKAYEEVLKNDKSGITDDAMIWERYYQTPVWIVEGDYFNIKITTPEDMIFGEAIIRSKR